MTFLGCKKLGSLQRWWEGTLLSHQPDKVAIPIDNFVYHFRLTAASKRPTIPWRKAEIQMWLVRKGIIFSAEDKKTGPFADIKRTVHSNSFPSWGNNGKVTVSFLEKNRRSLFTFWALWAETYWADLGRSQSKWWTHSRLCHSQPLRSRI